MNITKQERKKSTSRVAQIYLGDDLAMRVRKLCRKRKIPISTLGQAAFRYVLEQDARGTLKILEED